VFICQTSEETLLATPTIFAGGGKSKTTKNTKCQSTKWKIFIKLRKRTIFPLLENCRSSKGELKTKNLKEKVANPMNVQSFMFLAAGRRFSFCQFSSSFF